MRRRSLLLLPLILFGTLAARAAAFLPGVPLQLVSVNSGGTAGGGGHSMFPRASADGRYLLFFSYAPDLVPGFVDGNAPDQPDLYVRDTLLGTTRLVSVNADGTASGNASAEPPYATNGRLDNPTAAISADGRYIAFQSQASNLVLGAADTNGASDVFVRDMEANVTHLVSVRSSGDGPGNGPSLRPRISEDGRFVTFESAATNLVFGVDDANEGTDVFQRDLESLTTRVVSLNGTGTATGDRPSDYPLMSDDGRFVAFQSFAGDLVPGFTDGNFIFQPDVFLRDTVAGTTRLITRSRFGNQSAGGASFLEDLTPSGRHIAVTSSGSDLVEGVPVQSGPHLYLADAVADTVQIVSARTDRPIAEVHANVTSANVSEDGRFVAFAARVTNLIDNFVDRNGPGQDDIFLRDMTTGVTELVSAGDPPYGGGNGASYFARMEGQGRFVWFQSASTDLVPGFVDANGPSPDLFRYDRVMKRTLLVSRNVEGTAGGGVPPVFFGDRFPHVSPDGLTVAFQSLEPDLTPLDDRDKLQIYTGRANEIPVARPDVLSAQEDTELLFDPLTLLANDTDANSEPLWIDWVSVPDHGILSVLPDGTLRYLAAPDYAGPDTFSYRATDGVARSEPATVTVTVHPVNDPPTGVADQYRVSPGGAPLTVEAPGVLANDTDAEQSPLSAKLSTAPTHGSVQLNGDGSFVYTPHPGFTGTDTFTYRPSDGALDGSTVTVTLLVSGAPVAVDDAVQTFYWTGQFIPVLTNDTLPPGTSATVQVVTPPANGEAWVQANGSILYLPNSGFSGQDTFVYSATNAEGSDTATVTITVLPTPPPQQQASVRVHGSVKLRLRTPPAKLRLGSPPVSLSLDVRADAARRLTGMLVYKDPKAKRTLRATQITFLSALPGNAVIIGKGTATVRGKSTTVDWRLRYLATTPGQRTIEIEQGDGFKTGALKIQSGRFNINVR